LLSCGHCNVDLPKALCCIYARHYANLKILVHRYIIMRQCWLETPTHRPNFTDLRVQLELLLSRDRNYLELDNINVPLSTPESSSGSPVADDTKSLLAAQALQAQRKSSKDELTISVSVHDKSVERLLRKKGDFDAHNITIL